jgi:hypothetical protein
MGRHGQLPGVMAYMTDIDLWTVFAAMKSIKRQMKARNYGLMTAEIDRLGMMLDEELQPHKGLEWDYS